MRRVPSRWAFVVAAGLLLAACGGADAAPTPEELAGALVIPEDLGPGWVVEYSGALTDEMRAEAGGIDMCPEAQDIVSPLSAGRDSTGDWQADWQTAVQALEWQTAVLTLPVERLDAQPVSLAEALVSGDRDEMETLYTALSEGYRLCLSVPPSPDHPPVDASELVLPAVGSERFGWVMRLGDRDRWDMRWVIVRDGATVMVIAENEILSGESILTDDQIVDIVLTAARKLP